MNKYEWIYGCFPSFFCVLAQKIRMQLIPMLSGRSFAEESQWRKPCVCAGHPGCRCKRREMFGATCPHYDPTPPPSPAEEQHFLTGNSKLHSCWQWCFHFIPADHIIAYSCLVTAVSERIYCTHRFPLPLLCCKLVSTNGCERQECSHTGLVEGMIGKDWWSKFFSISFLPLMNILQYCLLLCNYKHEVL